MLFFLGLFASYVILGNEFARNVKEAVNLEVQIKDGVPNQEVDRFAREISKAPFVQRVEYISKEEALEEYKQRFNEDVTAPLDGFNPLMASFRVMLWSSYIQKDSLHMIRDSLMEELVVSSVEYPLEEILSLQANLRVVAWLTLAMGVVLLAIAFYLIFGTIRLGIYARRMAIRTMQLIGATDSFIRRPFVINGLVQGAVAGFLACFLVVVAWWFLSLLFPEPLPLWHLASFSFIGLLGGILLLGTMLGWAGSHLAVNRYLHKNLDELMQA